MFVVWYFTEQWTGRSVGSSAVNDSIQFDMPKEFVKAKHLWIKSRVRRSEIKGSDKSDSTLMFEYLIPIFSIFRMQFNFHFLPFHFLFFVFSLIRPHFGIQAFAHYSICHTFLLLLAFTLFGCTGHHKIHCGCGENENGRIWEWQM